MDSDSQCIEREIAEAEEASRDSMMGAPKDEEQSEGTRVRI
jgi:hypothetical protein